MTGRIRASWWRVCRPLLLAVAVLVLHRLGSYMPVTGVDLDIWQQCLEPDHNTGGLFLLRSPCPLPSQGIEREVAQVPWLAPLVVVAGIVVLWRRAALRAQ